VVCITVRDDRTIVNDHNGLSSGINENQFILLSCMPGGALSKEEIIELVWLSRGLIVSDSSYYQLMYQLRKSFVNIGCANTIKTIPRWGVHILCEIEYIPFHYRKTELRKV